MIVALTTRLGVPDNSISSVFDRHFAVRLQVLRLEVDCPRLSLLDWLGLGSVFRWRFVSTETVVRVLPGIASVLHLKLR